MESDTQSLASAPDLATTMFFTDDRLVAGTLIKTQHIAEVRAAVNAVRATAGLAQATFTDATLVGVIARTLHIEEPRNALDQARSLLDLPPLAYTDRPLAVGTMIKRVHVEELRGGVK